MAALEKMGGTKEHIAQIRILDFERAYDRHGPLFDCYFGVVDPIREREQAARAFVRTLNLISLSDLTECQCTAVCTLFSERP